MRPSNYDLQAQAAGHSFAAQDLNAIAARFALRRDETYLYLELLHEPLRLSRADGAAERQHGGVWMPAPFGAAMTAYDLLSNPNGFPVLAGQWCSHDSFNAVQAGTLQGQLKASVTPPAAQHFSGRIDRLRQAVARLGGTRTAPAIFPPCCRCCRSSRCCCASGRRTTNSRPSCNSCGTGTLCAT